MRFPVGFPVATINAVDNDPGKPFARASATTSADLLRTGLVILLWTDFPVSNTTPTELEQN